MHEQIALFLNNRQNLLQKVIVKPQPFIIDNFLSLPDILVLESKQGNSVTSLIFYLDDLSHHVDQKLADL